MAAKKVPHPSPQSQGLIHYLSTATPISLDNIELQRRGQVNDNLHLVSKILRDAVFAQAMVLHTEWKRAEAKHRHSEPAPLPERPEAPADVTEFDPFFRQRKEADAIRREQTPSHREIWANYYERYGCLVCESKSEPHASDGMCHNCHARISARRRGLEQGKGPYPVKRRIRS
jgi:hypothetical protein